MQLRLLEEEQSDKSSGQTDDWLTYGGVLGALLGGPWVCWVGAPSILLAHAGA